jgi:hypothetical protein
LKQMTLLHHRPLMSIELLRQFLNSQSLHCSLLSQSPSFQPDPLFAIELPVEPLLPAEQLNEGVGGAVHNRNEIGEGVVAACANHLYPLREQTPKVMQSINTMDFDNDPFEPGSFLEAMGCRQASLWQPSVLNEFSFLQQNGTWILVPLPPVRSAIRTRWVF